MSGRSPRWIQKISRGTPIGDLEVGTTVKINVNSTQREFLVVHQGLPSSMYDESCNGTWLLMKDIYERRQWNNRKSNYYRNSTISQYLNETFLGLFNLDIQEVIQQVKIPLSDGTGANGLSCKIFLLSGYEVGFTTSTTPSLPQDGAKLSYFELGTGTSANNKRIAKLNGSAASWWLRSPYTGGNDVWYVINSGNAGSYYATSSYGVRPALILPASTLVSDDMLIA